MKIDQNLSSSMTDNSQYTNPDWLGAQWMPFTGNREFKQNPRMIVAAEGCYFRDQHGRQIFDGLSGLWCCGLGHGRKEIGDAIQRQYNRLDYSPQFQFGHPRAFELANRLVEITPSSLQHAFFSNSGSESVDTALKIARAYWRCKGQAHRTRFIGREKGFHGVNFGGTAVGGMTFNRKAFGQSVESDHIAHTLLPQNSFVRGLPQQGAELAEDLARKIAFHDPQTIAAVIVEPIAGSCGVLPPPQGYLQRVAEICRQNDILLILDEVITGFGRLGSYTAAAAFGIEPDILTCAKQITNGVAPLAATLVSDDIYQAFMQADNPHYLIEFPHGYTYSGHPVVCAASLAVLDLLEQEQVLERVRKLAPVFENAVHQLKGAKHITDIRNYGLAAGFSLEPYTAGGQPEPVRRPYEVSMKMWEKGFYARYGGDALAFAPPFIATEKQIDDYVSALGETLQSVE